MFEDNLQHLLLEMQRGWEKGRSKNRMIRLTINNIKSIVNRSHLLPLYRFVSTQTLLLQYDR
jgi:hypothetical protein